MKSQDESSKVTAQELSETQVMLPNVAYVPKKKITIPLDVILQWTVSR